MSWENASYVFQENYSELDILWPLRINEIEVSLLMVLEVSLLMVLEVSLLMV